MEKKKKEKITEVKAGSLVTGSSKQSLLSVDYRTLVSQSDLIYTSPKTALESHAIGNGKMGTMVWTTSDSVNFQINRNDVFTVNKNHKIGEPTYYQPPNPSPVDEWNGCAMIRVGVGGNPFSGAGTFEQKLSLYDAEETIAGDDVTVRCFISSVSDVMVVEVDDRRSTSQPLELTVSMWGERGPAAVRYNDPYPGSSGYHETSFTFTAALPKVAVVQCFDEYFDALYRIAEDYHCRSAVAAQVVGPITSITSPSSTSRKIIAPAQSGKRLILISSAASFSNNDNVGTTAVDLLDAVSSESYNALRQSHVSWWHRFWSRTFVDLTSDDGSAEFMEKVRNLHLYYMASSSRGLYPPKWNGSIFTTNGNARRWGNMYWVWTTEAHYWPLIAADAADLTNPFFDMYVNQLDDAYAAGRQRWGVNGAFYPETAPFDGCVDLPAAIADEFQDAALRIKPKLSGLARAYARYEDHLYQLARNFRIGYTTHQLHSGSRLALAAWWRYRHTGDTSWLASHAYPLLKGTVQFYRNFAQKKDDGLYHIVASHAYEEFWCVDDSITSIAAIRSTVPLAIRAAEILGVDAGLRADWQNFLDKLSPYRMGSEPNSQALTGGVLADDVWSAGHYNLVNGSHHIEDVWLAPIFPYEDWTLETNDPSMDYIAQKVVDMALGMKAILGGANWDTALRSPIAYARAGRGSRMPDVLSSYYNAFDPMINGMSMFEDIFSGENVHSVEHLGILTCTIQEGLLQSVPPHPGEDEIINLFPAWPDQWDASYRLLARGGFLVTSSIKNGKVKFVEIESRLGETCRLRNPWGMTCTVQEIGGKTRNLSGDILTFTTSPGKTYHILSKS